MGGLGNQLFQYAAGRRLAHYNNAELRLDHVSGFVGDWYKSEYALGRFNIDGQLAARYPSRFGWVRRRLEQYVARKRPANRRALICEDDLGSPEDLVTLRLERDVYLHGYWQDSKYFEDIREDLQSDLDVRGPHDATSLEVAASIREGVSAGVHVRRLKGQPHGTGEPRARFDDESVDYYQTAVEQLVAQSGVDRVFVFSDHAKWARENLSFSVPTTYVTHNKSDRAYEDLWLMSQCDHFVLARSTFGWWPAWLGGHPEKQVIAPRGGGPGLLLKTIPDSWTQL